jgi:hypothetical protein
MKKTFWTALLAGALAFGMSNAFAQGVSSGKDRDLNTNQMEQAKTHATAALEAAKGGMHPVWRNTPGSRGVSARRSPARP